MTLKIMKNGKINCFTFFCVPRAAGGYGSESEAEDAADSHVTLPQDLPGRGNIKSEKSSVKVTEVELRYFWTS